MSKLKESWSYGSVLALLAALSFFQLPKPDAFRMNEAVSPRFEHFPYEVGAWQGKDSPVDERTYEILETRNVLSREYTNTADQTVHLLLVGSQEDRRVAHPPEVCYLSSNYVIAEEREGEVMWKGKPLAVREFLAASEKVQGHQEHVAYVYQVGDQWTTNYYAQQLRFAADRLKRKDTEILLIRVSGPSSTASREFLSEVLDVLS